MSTTDTDNGYIVRLLKLGVSPTAGQSGKPYAVVAHVPLWIDFDAPQVRLVESSHRQTQPSVFKSEKEAEEQMRTLLARLKAIRANTLRTARHANVGCAFELMGKTIDDKQIGGYEVVSASLWAAEAAEERKLQAQARQEELAEKEAAARIAQMTADSLREEIADGQFSSEWKAHASPGVQHRTTKAGDPRFRGRRFGNTSPTYKSLEEAQAWLVDIESLESRMLAKSR